MKVIDVMNCSFSAWYEKFEDVTINSIIMPITADFLEYLHADAVVLPEGSVQGAYCTDLLPDEDSDDDQQNRVDWTTGSDCREAEMPDCKNFLQEVDAAIMHLGGKVFPKLNWSCPQDASWVSLNNSLQCCHASDICLLFKSSDFISHDLTEPFALCEDGELASKDVKVRHDLVLRQWRDINSSHEFRCFVRHNKLIAICPRNHSKFFQHIADSHLEILTDLQEFFDEVIDGDFIAADGNYTFDVWRKKRGDVVLLDFNPFGPVTDPLLFSWEELTSGDDWTSVQFRYMESEKGVQPRAVSQFGVPTDFVDLASGQDPYKLLDLLKLKHSTGEESSSDEDEEEKEGNAVISETGR